MKRETKTVKAKKATKRVRKPKAKPVEEEIQFIFSGPIVPVEQKKIDVNFPEVWNEEVARAAKVLGVEPLEVITKLMAFLPEHYPNHLRMLETIVERERTVGVDEATKSFREAEESASRAGRAAGEAHAARVAALAGEIQRRREIIEPGMTLTESRCGQRYPTRKEVMEGIYGQCCKS